MAKIRNKNQKNTKRILALLGLSSIPLSICFLSLPAILLGGNRSEIPFAGLFYFYFVIAALLILGLIAGLYLFLGEKKSHLMASSMAAAGVLVYLFDVWAPLEIGPMMTGEERAPLLWFAGIMQTLLFILLARGIYKLNLQNIGSIGWAISAVFALFSLPNILPLDLTREENKESVTRQAPAQASKAAKNSAIKGNVYHFIFDSYYGPWLQWSTKEGQLPKDAFRDFTHYKSSRSNYNLTEPSFNSFFRGAHVVGDHPKPLEGTLMSDLKTAGFETHVWAALDKKIFKGVDHLEVAQSPPLLLIADYWVLRIVPVLARPWALFDGKGLLSRIFTGRAGDLRSFNSYQHFKKIMKNVIPTLAHEGHYYLFYFYPPHAPSQLDRDGNFVGKSSYSEQHILATRMIHQLMEKLRPTPSFDQSLVILQSDHGSPGGAKFLGSRDPLKDTVTLDPKNALVLTADNPALSNGYRMDAAYASLLLIKPPKGCGPTSSDGEIIREEMVQLLDLRRYLKGVVSGESKDCRYPAADSVQIFLPVLAGKRKSGRPRIEYLNFERLKDGNWRRHPRVKE